MIITCPECATRYDLEEDRFQPNGRSVRCTACGESWFVPPPEPIDALSRREPPRRQPERREPPVRESRSEPRSEPRAAFSRDAHHFDERGDGPRDRFAADAPRADHDDRSLRASRSEPTKNFRDFADGRDSAGQPEEAEISIVKSAEKDLLPPRDEKGRFLPRDAYVNKDDQFDDDEDDTLFDTPDVGASSASRSTDDDTPPKGWRKGKQFYVEDSEAEPSEDPRPFFAKHFSKGKKDEAPSQSARRDRDEDDRHQQKTTRFSEDDREHQRAWDSQEDTARDARRESPRGPIYAERQEPAPESHAAHAEARDTVRGRGDQERYNRDYEYDRDRDHGRGYHEARTHDDHDFDDDIIPGEATILDADWEDVEDGATGPRFGRRVREERRRATALARLEDVRRFEPEMFDEEFFRSLHVTPHELERAVRKARRRAEARDKNRLTPWRAFGWSAWVAAVAGAAYAVVAYRDEIVRAAPTAADAYAVVGIETDPVGLTIENVNHRLAMSTGGPVIEISGSLRNLGGAALDAPLLQAEALGPRGELLARWTFRAEEPTVGGGGVSPFTTRNSAPDGVSEVALSFAPGQSAITPR